MTRAWGTLMLGLGLALQAQGLPERTTSVALGAYQQSLTDGYGTWRGLILDASFNPGQGGAWIASAVTFDRPEGRGSVLSGGKYLTFEGGYAYLGAAVGTGAAYLPKVQAAADLNLAVGRSGWVLGGGVLRTEVRDGHRDLLLQAGPTLYAKGWVFTFRHLRNRSDPGGRDSSAQFFEARRGTDDRKAWQSLGVAWGSEAYESLAVRQAVATRGVRATFNGFLPLTEAQGLKLTAEWGQKNGIYRFWGGSLRWVWLF